MVLRFSWSAFVPWSQFRPCHKPIGYVKVNIAMCAKADMAASMRCLYHVTVFTVGRAKVVESARVLKVRSSLTQPLKSVPRKEIAVGMAFGMSDASGQGSFNSRAAQMANVTIPSRGDGL